MRRPLMRVAMMGFLSGAVVVGGSMLFSQAVLLIMLALLVVVAAVALSVERSFRLFTTAPVRKAPSATAPRAGAALPR